MPVPIGLSTTEPSGPIDVVTGATRAPSWMDTWAAFDIDLAKKRVRDALHAAENLQFVPWSF